MSEREREETGRRVERALRHAARHFARRPGLDELARVAGLSRFHFDRVFRTWVGLPPVRFVQMLTLAEGKRFLAEGRSVLETSLGLGLSGPSRLHDLFVGFDAVTPGDWKTRGRGLRLRYGVQPTAFGRALVGLSPRGICWFTFVADGDRADGVPGLEAAFPEATLRRDQAAAAGVVARVFTPGAGRRGERLSLHVRGSNFQTKVWSALLSIPPGVVASYGDVARAIGQPGAVRAVGTACGKNPIGVLIPCHRVIRETGALGQYGFGVERKRALLAWEACLHAGHEG